MKDKRRHKRFRSDVMGINGKMIMAHKVDIMDISLGGVALRVDRRLNIGREYQLKLEEKGRTLDVRGVVVRSELVGIETRDNGDTVSIYTAGLMFKNTSSDMIAGFINSIEQVEKETVPVMVDQRQTVRFHITTPREKTLRYPAQFMVKEISLSGMLIQTEHALDIESLVPMGLSLQADKHVSFIGRVASCRTMEVKGQAQYEIGVEFKDLMDADRALLTSFMDYLNSIEAKPDARRTDNLVTENSTADSYSTLPLEQ